MSGIGISTTWLQISAGIPSDFVIGSNALNLTCDLDFLGDVIAELTLALVCEIQDPNINPTIFCELVCDFDLVGDVVALYTLAQVCGLQFNADIAPLLDIDLSCLFDSLGDVFFIDTLTGGCLIGTF